MVVIPPTSFFYSERTVYELKSQKYYLKLYANGKRMIVPDMSLPPPPEPLPLHPESTIRAFQAGPKTVDLLPLEWIFTVLPLILVNSSGFRAHLAACLEGTAEGLGEGTRSVWLPATKFKGGSSGTDTQIHVRLRPFFVVIFWLVVASISGKRVDIAEGDRFSKSFCSKSWNSTEEEICEEEGIGGLGRLRERVICLEARNSFPRGTESRFLGITLTGSARKGRRPFL